MTPSSPPLILASSSPRRSRLLRTLGLRFALRIPAVDERALPGETPRAHVRRLAAAKVRAVARDLREGIVIGADTVVALDGEILGKPSGPRDAARMLARLAGRTHEVWSGIAVARAGGGRTRMAVVRTRVTMRPLSAAAIRRYVAGGEPLDKAGAYAAQGKGRRFIARIDGDRTNVIGLPLAALARLLGEAGLPVDVKQACVPAAETRRTRTRYERPRHRKRHRAAPGG